MSKKNENKLGIAAIVPDFGFSPAGSMVPMNSSQSYGQEKHRMLQILEQRLAAQSHVEIAVSDAMCRMASLAQHAVSKFQATGEVISQTKQEAQGKDFQPYVEEFTHHVSQIAAQQMLGALKLGGTALAQEMIQSPYPPPLPTPDPPEQRTWLGRLLLGDDR